MGLGADGEIARGTGAGPVWVTGEAARRQGHLMRAEADAILVGRGTVADDDPQLTCRLPGLTHRSPLRVVLASRADVPLSSKLVRTARDVPVWVFCAATAPQAAVDALEAAGVRVTRVTTVGGELWLPAVTEALAAAGITRLLVEGGPSVWQGFARLGLVDEIVLFRARGPSTDSLDVWAQALLQRYAAGRAFDLVRDRRLRSDDMLILRPHAKPHPSRP
jgi:diaminohydroxyphosphoribosylaminopyrimidine deaminase/5-amino-6-(5-phosphoribosylamino)uracil reductase